MPDDVWRGRWLLIDEKRKVHAGNGLPVGFRRMVEEAVVGIFFMPNVPDLICAGRLALQAAGGLTVREEGRLSVGWTMEGNYGHKPDTCYMGFTITPPLKLWVFPDGRIGIGEKIEDLNAASNLIDEFVNGPDRHS